MDPTTLLDHALFHLTPTRTRCDLFAVAHPASSSSTEKIAAGLLDPFRSHLRAASELIPKGGYSFTLRPATVPARWFTKATLERFVRFVATPEILERVVTIEKEIVQIEQSIQREYLPASGGLGAKKPVVSSKGNEDPSKDIAAEEENSKICLARVLDNRKAMLQKEQGMAYARASVAGFDSANLDDLVLFSDAFGADRLREACINFKELCKEKEQDKLWVDELAALEASRAMQLSYMGASGITLASEVNTDDQQEQNGADDSMKAPTGNGAGSAPWNSGPYLYNFQNPGITGSTPFPGYVFPFPGMPMIPPYAGYPENFHWPNRGEEKDVDAVRYRGMPEKLHRSVETARSSRDEYSDDENSDSGSETDEIQASTDVDSSKRNNHPKKSKKKSSRTVVIRNINYISSKGRHGENDNSDKSSPDGDLIDGDALRRQVEDIFGSFGKHQISSQHHAKNKGDKRNFGSASISMDSDDNKVLDDEASAKASKDKMGEGWDAFQNILMREDSLSDDNVQKSTDIYTTNGAVMQRDAAGDYCRPGSGETTTLSSANYQLHEEIGKGIKPKRHASDPLIDSKVASNYAGKQGSENFEFSENGHYLRRAQNSSEDYLTGNGMRLEMDNRQALSSIGEESPRLRGRGDGDWFLASGSEGKLARDGHLDHIIFEGEQIVRIDSSSNENKEKKLNVAIDDSFIAPSRVVDVEQQSFSWKTDVNIISGGASTDQRADVINPPKDMGKSEYHEPEELHLLVERHCEVDDVRASWNPEVEYMPDITHNIVEEKKSVIQASPANEIPISKATKIKTQVPSKISSLSRSVTKNKLEALSRPKTISTLSRKGSTLSKTEKEEIDRKRIEEARIEREKRIAMRSAGMGSTTASKLTGAEKKPSVGKLGTSQTNKQHGFGYAAKANGIVRKS